MGRVIEEHRAMIEEEPPLSNSVLDTKVDTEAEQEEPQPLESVTYIG
jgi:hypothetical protein